MNAINSDNHPDPSHVALMRKGSQSLAEAIKLARDGIQITRKTPDKFLPPEGKERTAKSERVVIKGYEGPVKERVLAMTGDGYSVREIAAALRIGSEAVNRILGREIMKELSPEMRARYNAKQWY